MRILLLAQHYAPEEVSGAVLATELAEDLSARGHKVTFITCAPNYPYGKVFSGYRNSFYRVEIRNGVRVIRTWSYINPGRDLRKRTLNYTSFSASAFYGGMLAGRPDVIFSYSPPLPLGLSAWLLSTIWHVPWVLRVEDLFPDAALAAGVLHNRNVIHFFIKLEKFLYSQATLISVISNNFRQIIVKKGVPEAKIDVAPVWADPDAVQLLPKENAFRKQHGLLGKFVVMYAGNLGITSALEDIVETARLMIGDPTIRFVIVGEGVKKEALKNFCDEHKLDNVLFLPFQPRERFSGMMAAADISLVTLNPASSPYSMPCKTFNILASGRPVLAVTPGESELSKIIQGADAGISVSPNQPDALVQAIRGLEQDPEALDRMGKNGRALLETTYSRKLGVNLYENTLRRAVETC